jgi:CyaY protein
LLTTYIQENMNDTSDTMTEAQFRPLAQAAINAVRRACDVHDPDVVEAVTDGDVVKLSFASGQPFVLNMQRPVREMWLAADRQAWHFRYDGAHWRDKRSGEELFATIALRVKERCGLLLAI